MLPDWPRPKWTIYKFMNRIMQERAHAMSIANMVSQKPVFEGHANSIRRADGVVETADFHSATGEATIPVDAIKSGDIHKVMAALLPVSDQVGASMAKSMFDTIEAGVRSVGNEIDAGGKPMTAEVILEMFERIMVDFDENGQPKWPTVVHHPSQNARLLTELTRLEADPVLAQRFADITDRKREEWRAREAGRILVG
jgi:hypothetical protein